jgi:formylglycine-generating enzyme required for sulfatase activity
MRSGWAAACRRNRSSSTRRKRARAETPRGSTPQTPGRAPVACYAPNALGLYDLVGNVWEWTASAYYPRHDFAAKAEHPAGYDPSQPDEPVAVLKGGSHLCAPEYCMRYRPQARIGQSKGLGASHIGFRTVRNEE